MYSVSMTMYTVSGDGNDVRRGGLRCSGVQWLWLHSAMSTLVSTKCAGPSENVRRLRNSLKAGGSAGASGVLHEMVFYK